MSADNWAICPKCKERLIEENRKEVARVSDAYGKVSEEEYARMKADLESTDPLNGIKHTLREDYEIGVESDGTFCVDFRASCSECDFSFSYEREITLDQ